MKTVRWIFQFTLSWCLGLCFLYGLYLFALQIYPPFPTRLADLFRPRADGFILVTSPTVYTRQRLVNDRLAQTSWLQEQLNVTNIEDKEFRPLDRISNVSNLSVGRFGASIQANLGASSKLKEQSGDAGKGKTEDASKQSSDAATNEEKGPAAQPGELAFLPTSSTMFRAKNSYRDEVRTEMMEAQLDDRHDIQGNTVYRLAFNVSVLPTPENDGLALVFVRLHRPRSDPFRPAGPKPDLPEAAVTPARLSDTSAAPKPSSGEKQTELDNKEADVLYADWLRYVQRVVDESLNGIVSGLRNRNFVKEQRVASAIPILAGIEVCRALYGPNAPKLYDRDAPTLYGPGKPCSPTDGSGLNNARTLLAKYRDIYLNRRADIFKTKFRDTIRTAAKNPAEAKEYLYAADIDISSDIFERLKCDFVANTLEIASKSRKASLKVPCPIADSPPEGLLAAVMLYSRLKALELAGIGSDKLLPALTDDFVSRCNEKNRTGCELTERQLKCVAADILKAQLDKKTELRSVEELEEMEYFLKLHVIGQDVENCSIVVQSTGSEGRKRLTEELDKAVEVFTYSVNPRNLAQRVSLSAKRRESLETSLDASMGSSAQELRNWIRQLAEKASNSQAVNETPIVVGFSLPIQRSKNAPDAPGEKSSDNFSRETAFGWAIAPQRAENGTLQQIDSHYPVSAVVSLPAWWRSVELDVSTCWMGRREMATVDLLDKADLLKKCDKSGQSSLAVGAQPHEPSDKPEPGIQHQDREVSRIQSVRTFQDIVRLPGAISELSSKLGFEIVQEPHLKLPFDQAPPPIRVEVGRPFNLLLTGFRIWRSTEVTLGAQKSDSITVLPNMEGIVATFKCVEAQTPVSASFAEASVSASSAKNPASASTAKSPGASSAKTAAPSSAQSPVLAPSQDQLVDVRVWTSEGVTDPVQATLVITPALQKAQENRPDSLRSICGSSGGSATHQTPTNTLAASR
ncbi:MAG: hypothetical protein QOG66_3536 [Methylobacteriaceae bacterium]|jgi:hypothetical protein|nr:hypothetical protein [Methylobacteriaceae bacterium]